jgi:hypothetical protein
MTAAHSSPSLDRRDRRAAREVPAPPACLRLRWSIAPAALGQPCRKPMTLELELREGEPARLTLEGQACQPAAQWASAWDGTLTIRRVGAGPGKGLVIVEALPLAVVVLRAEDAGRPLHVACDLPKALGLAGGRYELLSGGLSG